MGVEAAGEALVGAALEVHQGDELSGVGLGQGAHEDVRDGHLVQGLGARGRGEHGHGHARQDAHAVPPRASSSRALNAARPASGRPPRGDVHAARARCA